MRMPISVIVAGALIALASPSFAQNVTAGAKFGMTVASISSFEDAAQEALGARFDRVEVNSRIGVIGGAYIGIRVNELFSVQPEMLFAQKGTTLDVTFRGVTVESSIDIDYLEIPVLGAFSFQPQQRVRPFVFAGPAFGIRLRAEAEVAGQELEGFDEGIRNWEAGLVFGGGVEISRLSVEARYNVGLTDLSEEREPGDPELKNRAFSVLVGVRFN